MRPSKEEQREVYLELIRRLHEDDTMPSEGSTEHSLERIAAALERIAHEVERRR